jgi:hypothetical protein
MLPVHRDMLRDGLIDVARIDFGDDIIEHRTIARVDPKLKEFTEADISFIDAAIEYYWHKTGMETSDDSHGVAWKTRKNNDPMPYELALLSDRTLSKKYRQRADDLIYRLGLVSE